MKDFLWNGPADADATMILAHGAGAGIDTPFMNTVAEGLACRGLLVVRFEFPYMRRRRQDGKRRPPDRMPALLQAYADAVAEVREKLRPPVLAIGGKSMGGRVASMVADELRVDGLVCLGYPFHPPGRPSTLRTEHLQGLRTPALIVQGTRDALGTREEVAGFDLSSAIAISWAEDGDHDLKPRRASGRTHDENLTAATQRVADFVRGLAPATRRSR